MEKILVIFFVITFAFQDTSKGQTNDSQTLGSKDAIYLGLKIGMPYLAGLDMGFLIADKQRVRAYVNASVQSIIILNSANIGLGYFIGKNGFSIGVRSSAYAHILETAISDEESGVLVAPELGWFKAVGKSKNTIISLQLGPAGLNFSYGIKIY